MKIAAPRRPPPPGFLPEAWFKDQKRKLAEALKTPLDRSIDYWPWQFTEQVVQFPERFAKEFEDVVSNRLAGRAVRERAETRKGMLEKVAARHSETFGYLGGHTDFSTPEGYLDWAARGAISDRLKEGLKTVADLTKAVYSVDSGAVATLVKKTLKAATPEERSSLTDDQRYETKYRFFARVRFEDSAKRLLKREKIEWSVPDWIDFVYDMLKANYAEGGSNVALREFDVHGMKVIVDDDSLGPGDLDKYVKYLDETYQRMRAKGVAKAWYGTVFIQCEDCGGVNYNTGGGVGGHFKIGPDAVAIFSRPSRIIVELMAHELGHRYWFKQMSSTQRAKFESLVKVKPGPRPDPDKSPPRLLPEGPVSEAKKKVRELGDTVRAALKEFKVSRLPSASKALAKLQPIFDQAASQYRQEFLDAVHSAGANSQINAEVKGLFQDVLDIYPKVPYMLRAADSEVPRRLNAYPDDGTWTYETMYKDARAKWIREVEGLVDQAEAAALIYIDRAVQVYNEVESDRPSKTLREWQEKWDNDARPVTPVSNYGQSNIDEAFAEVFSHYVLGEDMTRDQLESFRSVLSSAGWREAFEEILFGVSPSRVARVFLAARVAARYAVSLKF